MNLPTAASAIDPRTQRVADFYEDLVPEDLDRLALVYTEDAFFKDPFNEVRGLASIRHIFEHMFQQLAAPRFEVLSQVSQGDEAWLSWYFWIQRGGEPMCIRGATQLRYAPDGRVCWHRDYWDPAEELYSHIPVLGVLMRWLRRKLSATAGRSHPGT